MKQRLRYGEVAGNERTCAIHHSPFHHSPFHHSQFTIHNSQLPIHHSPFNWFLILAPAVQSIGRMIHNENYPSGVTHLFARMYIGYI